MNTTMNASHSDYDITNTIEFKKAYERIAEGLYRNGIPTGPRRLRQNAEFLVTLRTLEWLQSEGLWTGDFLLEARRLCRGATK